MSVRRFRPELFLSPDYPWLRTKPPQNSGGHGSADEISNTNSHRHCAAHCPFCSGFPIWVICALFNRKDIAAEEAAPGRELEAIAGRPDPVFMFCRRAGICAMSSIKRITTQIEEAEAFEVGMAPYANVLQNKVELSEAKEQLIKYRKRHTHSRNTAEPLSWLWTKPKRLSMLARLRIIRENRFWFLAKGSCAC